MDLTRDLVESNRIIEFIEINPKNVTFRHWRRLLILYHKFWVELLLLPFECPPRNTSIEEYTQLCKLRAAIGSDFCPNPENDLVAAAYQELIDESQLVLDRGNLSRAREYTLLMNTRYLIYSQNAGKRR